MKKVKFLGKQLGEYSYTPHSIIEVWNNQEFDKYGDKIDFEKTTTCLYSSDDWRLVPKKLYSVLEVEIPEWMSAEEYLENEIKWKYYKNAGGTEELGKEVFFKLTKLDPILMLACIKLLKTKKFRSEFRKSLKDQLDKWIEGETNYSQPFSRRQLDSLVNTHLISEAKSKGLI